MTREADARPIVALVLGATSFQFWARWRENGARRDIIIIGVWVWRAFMSAWNGTRTGIDCLERFSLLFLFIYIISSESSLSSNGSIDSSMFFFNYLAPLINKAVCALWSDNGSQTTESESSALLGRNSYSPSLSGKYEGFEQSFTAFKLCVFHVTCYYLAAVLCFSFLFEKWTVIDSIYFATVLFTTVGFGDLSPSTFLGQVSVIFLAFYGIVLLGIFLGIAGQNIAEYQSKILDGQRKDVRRKILETVEKAAVERHQPGVPQSWETSRIDVAAEVSLIQEIKKVMVLGGPILFIVLIGGVVLGHFEGWTVFER